MCGALSVARAEGNGSVAERTWLIVGELVEITTGLTFMTEGGRPVRYSLVRIRRGNRHKVKAGEEVTVFTRGSIWEENGELRVRTNSTSPSPLVRPGAVVATRLIKGDDYGTGRPTKGSWQVVEFSIVRENDAALGTGHVYAQHRFTLVGEELGQHFERTGSLDLTRLDYGVSKLPIGLGQYVENAAQSIGIRADQLLAHPEERDR